MKRYCLSGRLVTWVACLGVMASVAGCPWRRGPHGVRAYGGALGRAVKAGVATGSTVGKNNEVTPECDSAGVPHRAPDVSYTWVAPYTDSFVIDTQGSTFDTVLLVRTYQGSTLVGCNDNAAAGNPQSSLTLSLQAGVAYILTVDGHGDSAGTYQLNIDSVSCPGGCEPEPNGCYGPVNLCDTARRACIHTYMVDADCDDGDPCTVQDKCNATGQCVAGTSRVCASPPDSCHASSGTCDAATGQCSYAFAAVGTKCDDGNPCTLNDVCNRTGQCGGTAVACNSPPDDCYASSGTCDAATGQCGYTFKSANTACDDGSQCTSNDVCDGAGRCVGTAMVCSPPQNSCYASGVCNAATGQCSYARRPAGFRCGRNLTCEQSTCDGAGNCRTKNLCPIRPCKTARCTPEGCQYEPHGGPGCPWQP